MSEKQSSNVAQLPDGWKMYDKYQIRHTDGTPLKGKKYFVLRLDSDNPAEAARVAAAMCAYKGELSEGDSAKMREALKFLIKHKEWLRGHNLTMTLEDLETIDRILGKADAALATPPRNCDRDLSDRRAIWAELRQWVHAKSCGCATEPSASDAFEWLLAPATEKEGGANV